MRYLILSDIHSNWEALCAVLNHAEGQYDQIVCLGDLVGYGPDPNRVVEWAQQNLPIIVRGNHDRACIGLDDLENYSLLAGLAAEWTNGVLSSANIDYLRKLARGPVAVDNFDIVHGSPKDEGQYLSGVSDAEDAFHYARTRITFFGHTHIQGGFQIRQGKVRLVDISGSDNEFELNPDTDYFLNPGSVGQPRDWNEKAGYALFDPANGTVTFRRVEYPFQTTQKKIRETTLPVELADRLAIGR